MESRKGASECDNKKKKEESRQGSAYRGWKMYVLLVKKMES